MACKGCTSHVYQCSFNTDGLTPIALPHANIYDISVPGNNGWLVDNFPDYMTTAYTSKIFVGAGHGSCGPTPTSECAQLTCCSNAIKFKVVVDLPDELEGTNPFTSIAGVGSYGIGEEPGEPPTPNGPDQDAVVSTSFNAQGDLVISFDFVLNSNCGGYRERITLSSITLDGQELKLNTGAEVPWVEFICKNCTTQ